MSENNEHTQLVGAGQLPPIPLKRLDKELPLPKRAHTGDAGADLYSAETITLEPGQRALVGTGVALALPLGTVGLIHPRSGLAAKHGLSIVNTPGTVDAQYRGELKVCLVNTDRSQAFTASAGCALPNSSSSAWSWLTSSKSMRWMKRSAARAVTARPGRNSANR